MADSTTIMSIGTRDHKIDFEVSMPYTAGHVCTENEARALNQTRKENIGNQMRSAVQAHINGEDGALSEQALRDEVAKRDANYQFPDKYSGEGRRSLNPVEAEAFKIARDLVKKKMKSAGFKTIADYDADRGEGAYEAKVAEVAALDQVQKIAKANLKAIDNALDALDAAA